MLRSESITGVGVEHVDARPTGAAQGENDRAAGDIEASIVKASESRTCSRVYGRRTLFRNPVALGASSGRCTTVCWCDESLTCGWPDPDGPPPLDKRDVGLNALDDDALATSRSSDPDVMSPK